MMSWPMDSKFQATWFQANIDFLALLSFLLFRFVYYLFLDFGIVFCQQQDQDRWQNARWKNHEVMSWRDIKLQWWASISCFPFDLGFLHLIWQPFRSPLDSAWRNLWQGTWRRNHQTTIEMRWRWRMRTQSLLAGRPSIFMIRLQSFHQSTCQEG